MNIAATELKSLLKKFSGSKADQLLLDTTAGKITATDSDTLIVVTSDLLRDSFVTSVNARKFIAAVNRLSGNIAITWKNSLVLKSARATIELEVTDAKPVKLSSPERGIKLPLLPVRDMLQYAAAAADTERASAFGGVVQLSTENSGIDTVTVTGLKAAGTNGQRLQVATHADESYPAALAPLSTLIPLPAVAVLRALDGDTLSLGETDSHVYLQAGNTEIWSAKLTKTYPDYSRFIPKEFKYVFEVDAAEMLRVLKTVDLTVDGAISNACTVHFLDGTVTVKSYGTGDSAEDACAYTQITPDPAFDMVDFSAMWNHKFIADFFAAASGVVTISANSAEKPFVFSAGNKTMLVAAVTMQGRKK